MADVVHLNGEHLQTLVIEAIDGVFVAPMTGGAVEQPLQLVSGAAEVGDQPRLQDVALLAGEHRRQSGSRNSARTDNVNPGSSVVSSEASSSVVRSATGVSMPSGDRRRT